MTRKCALIVGVGATGVAMAPTALAAGLGDAADVQISWWRVIGALIICVLLAVAIIYALRTRLGGQSPKGWAALWLPRLGAAPERLGLGDRRLRLAETVRLSHQVDVCLLDCSGLEVAIAVSPQGAVLLFAKPRGPAASADSATDTPT